MPKSHHAQKDAWINFNDDDDAVWDEADYPESAEWWDKCGEALDDDYGDYGDYGGA